MSSVTIGIDPGFTGALSLFAAGRLQGIKDMPIEEIEVASKGAVIRDLIGGKKNHTVRMIRVSALANLIRDWVGTHSAVIYLEDVHTMPGQGVVSSAKLMKGVGIVLGIAAALTIPLVLVGPSKWKKATNTPADKGLACERATEVFPEWTAWFKRKSIDHGRAEAALIGWYGVQQEAKNV